MGDCRVLVTGMAGTIGGVIRRYLGDKYDLAGLDRVPVDGVASCVADISDLSSIRPAFEGQDTVVHLAADPSPSASWDSTLQHNLVGTYNVLEASREAGVRRVVFASTNHVVGYHYLNQEPYKTVVDGRHRDVPKPFDLIDARTMRPDGYYGVSKHFGESIGSYYQDEHGMSFIAIRIGWVTKDDKSPDGSALWKALWLSHRDGAHLVERCIEAPSSVGFAVVYGVSNNTTRFLDIETAKELIGYDPQDDAGE